ncbi:MAG: hypothetical protein ABI672_21435, partial [Vicinamibacteria bacterium]
TLAEVGFAYMKKFGAQNVQTEPGKPQGYEETGSVSRDIPGLGFSAKSSNFPNHTFEMEADALTDVGHQGFTVDAVSMAALLFDFATRPEYRALVKKEFSGIQALQAEYITALAKPYQVPKVADPK